MDDGPWTIQLLLSVVGAGYVGLVTAACLAKLGHRVVCIDRDAQRIVDWRTAHGGFTSVSQLRQVTGIGDSKFADLQPLVRV